ncbi:MAG TPA: hypothetical protein VK712_03220 [Verrucomicrobiae bacterium]|nr:hypothetical protein [Verrucomicrobiae bacterium]
MVANPLATKKDVEEIVGRVVGELISEAIRLISVEFNKVYVRFEQIDRRFEQIEARLDRMEDRLDRTAALVDLYTVDIRALQRKTA